MRSSEIPASQLAAHARGSHLWNSADAAASDLAFVVQEPQEPASDRQRGRPTTQTTQGPTCNGLKPDKRRQSTQEVDQATSLSAGQG
eukprot:748740-Hanusia_phi.AAC.1